MRLNPRIFLIGGILILAAAVTAILFFYDPSRVPIYPVCPFHQVTHLNCPGCGGLRATHELLHGHLLEALRLNPVWILSLPILMGLGFRFGWNHFKKKPGLDLKPIWLWGYLGVWIAFGVLRNLPVQPLAVFAP
jgi:hypothetical protein